MREESHLDEMRSAIRGDFERLKERRGEQELMRVAEPQPDPPAQSAGMPTAPVEEPPVGSTPGRAPELEPHRRWLARLFPP